MHNHNKQKSPAYLRGIPFFIKCAGFKYANFYYLTVTLAL